MKIVNNNLMKKILIVVIVTVMTTNFVMPNYVYAKESVGEQIVDGICYLVAYIGDAFIKVLQKTMVGTSDIKESGKYNIKYSPGIIFSNTVPALDIDFIGKPPSEADTTITTTGELRQDRTSADFLKDNITLDMFCDDAIQEWVQWSKSIPDDVKEIYGFESSESLRADSNGGSNPMTTYCKNATVHLAKDSDWRRMYFWIDNNKLYKLEFVDILGTDNEYRIYSADLSTVSGSVAGLVEQRTNTSSTRALRDNIAKWYVALRTIALVGLLSVFLYIGIRILLSSTSAQEQAKYKNMLKDWLVAVCILFVLHYLMAFMLTFTDNLNDIIKSTVLQSNPGGTNTDVLMNTVREKIGDDLNNVSENAGYTIMYFVLVILTISFTIQYLKRVVYIAFLTMIAPMIALTYPLDKIKDSKAQAFSFWLKEFMVNCLIQPVHLLIYTILVTNAIDFAAENILYGIVALTFLMPAEKIIKQMFGLNQQQSSFNTLGAAAGGAMVMNMLNKVKGIGPKGGGSQSGGDSGGNQNNVRTATRNGVDPNAGGAGGTGGNAGGPAGGGSGTPLGAPAGGTGGGSGSGSGGGTGGGSGSGSGGGSGSGASNGSSGSSTGGTSGGSFSTSSGGGRNRAIRGASVLLSTGKWAGGKIMKKAPGLVGAAVGGMIGLSAAIADGEYDDVFAKTGIGMAAGSAIATNMTKVPGAAADAISGAKEDILKDAMGEEAYNNAQFDKQFYRSDGYKKILSSSTLKANYSDSQIRAQTQMFLDNGITDPGAIQEALESGVNGDEFRTMSDMGVTDVKKFSKIKNSKKTLGASEIASRMAIAKNLPPELYGDKVSFTRFAKRFGIEKDDAEALFNDIDDYV